MQKVLKLLQKSKYFARISQILTYVNIRLHYTRLKYSIFISVRFKPGLQQQEHQTAPHVGTESHSILLRSLPS